MAMFFWYLVKSDDSVRAPWYSGVHWTSHYLQGTRNTRPCITGTPVYTGYYIQTSISYSMLQSNWNSLKTDTFHEPKTYEPSH